VLAFLVINSAKAQDTMRINQSDGTVLEIAINDIKKITFDNLVSIPLHHPVIKQLFSLKLYPNPAKDQVNIEYTLNVSGIVNLEIYSLAGALIYSSMIGHKQQGDHTWRWQTNNIPSGTYICLVRQNQIVVTEKVIVKH
jgi:hypothetical protein